METSALVIFENTVSEKDKQRLLSRGIFTTVFAPRALATSLTELGHTVLPLEDFVTPGSIYEGSAFARELSILTLPNGTRIAKSFLYEGYELWWQHYTKFMLNFGLPYSQYRTLLHSLKDFDRIALYRPRYEALFECYLSAHNRVVYRMCDNRFEAFSFPKLGVVLQIGITLVSLPFLLIQRHKILFFTGDKFEKNHDYDSRMGFVYQALRERNVPFTECIRSLEPWKTVLGHAWTRKRPVIYSEAVASVARGIGYLTGRSAFVKETYGARLGETETDPFVRFKLRVATWYLKDVHADIWAIRIMRVITKYSGIRAAFFTAVQDRNFHAFLGCKLNNVKTVGILHGVSSCDYNIYDFMPTFDGEKSLTVDTYGVWSNWWKEYYERYGKAYSPEQLVVSGPMRPVAKENPLAMEKQRAGHGPLRVLFISEQLAVPEEVLPFLKELMEEEDIVLFMKFRPYRDGFELWLNEHHPEILKDFPEERIMRGDMKTAIEAGDVVVGSHSTAVLKAPLSLKPVVFFATQKWGDYFSLREYPGQFVFYTETPEAFIRAVRMNQNVPAQILEDLRERFFGNPHQNGSAWVAHTLESFIQKG